MLQMHSRQRQAKQWHGSFYISCGKDRYSINSRAHSLLHLPSALDREFPDFVHAAALYFDEVGAVRNIAEGKWNGVRSGSECGTGARVFAAEHVAHDDLNVTRGCKGE